MHKTFPCGHPYIRGKLFRPLFRDQMKGRPLTVRLAGESVFTTGHSQTSPLTP